MSTDFTHSTSRSSRSTTGDDDRRRRALIVVTDGEDRASYYPESQLFQRLRQANPATLLIASLAASVVALLVGESGFVVVALVFATLSGGAALIGARVDVNAELGYWNNAFHHGRWLQINERRTKDGGYVSVGTDITRIKEHEQKLVDNDLRLRATVIDLKRSQTALEQQALELADLADDHVLADLVRHVGHGLGGRNRLWSRCWHGATYVETARQDTVSPRYPTVM